MKTVVLCGGMGTRLMEETTVRPKPMVSVGGKPILWHILNHYAHFGFRDYVLALGYKAEAIKEYFLNYRALSNDFHLDLASGEIRYQKKNPVDWKVQLVDTGDKTLTGGRLLRLAPSLGGTGTFFVTYGDGVCDVNLTELLAFHKSHGKLVTVTGVRPTARFGTISFEGDQVTRFKEKVQSDQGWINGGYFVMEPGIFEYLENDQSVLEGEPMERLVRDKQLMVFRHAGFWQCMDTVRDRQLLEDLWSSGTPPWRVWKE